MFHCTLVLFFVLSILTMTPITEAGPLSLALDRRTTAYTGDGTWFNTGLGSCGINSNDGQLVAALNAPQMTNGANPNANPNCGKKAKITNVANGKTVTVTIVDTCPPCVSGSIDMSPTAFQQIAALSTGRIKISWTWVS